jgi:heme a synthase
VAWLSVATAAGMFVVLLAGITVTTTGSAAGCGQDWPLCRGRFIPEFALSTAIEYTHRVITGGETLLVLALSAGMLWLYRNRRSVTVLVSLLVGSIVLQAGMGAWAVMRPQQPLVLALHFGISLIAFAAAVLAALAARWPERTLAHSPLPRGVDLITWGTTAYLYGLVYTGAYIRHAAVAYACPTWPLCGSNPAPAAVAINLAHRSAAGLALLLALGLVLLYVKIGSRRDLYLGAWTLTVGLAAQALAGAYLVLSGWSLYAELVHASLTAFVFSAGAYLCLRVTLHEGRQSDSQDGSPVQSAPVS